MHIANSIIWLLSVGRKCKLKTELHADAACDRRFVGHFQRWWKSFIKRVSTGKKIHYYCTNYKSVLLLRLFPLLFLKVLELFSICKIAPRAIGHKILPPFQFLHIARAQKPKLLVVLRLFVIPRFLLLMCAKMEKGDECCQCHSGKCHFPAKKDE